MIGIFQDNIVDYFKNFSPSVRVTQKNIIMSCPFCEYNQKKKHYHLYISTEAPIYHCFSGSCNQSGILSKLFKKLDGIDSSEKFIDQTKVKEIKSNELKIPVHTEKNKMILPDLREDYFKMKTLYLKNRLKYSTNNLSTVKGLVFDVDKFIEVNNIKMDKELERIKSFLQSNFIGFLSENESVLVLRNIDPKTDFRYFKLFISQTRFLDYYKLYGANYHSNQIIIAEGIFDIYSEQIFDYTGLRNQTKLYAAGFSTSFSSLIKSIVFEEMIFRLDVNVLADRGIGLDYFKKIKKYNSPLIEKMTVFYNKVGKDFGDSDVIPEKFIL